MIPEPTPENVRAFMERHQLDGEAMRAVLGVSERTIRRYTSAPDKPNARRLPAFQWASLLLIYGEIDMQAMLTFIGKEN